MAHEFESGVFTNNQPAWHGLGVTLPNESLDSREALQFSGLADWGLTKQPVYAGNVEDGFEQIPGKYAVTRQTDRRVLGVVGETYRIVHNEEAFDWMDSLLGGEGFHYHTAGSLRSGQIVWLLAKAPFAIELPDSTVDMYVLLSNSHDGSKAVQAAISPVRVVCMNTLRAALHAKEASYTIRHTTRADSKLAEAQKVLGLAKGAAKRMEAEAKRLRKQKLTDADFRAFLDALVPVAVDDNGKESTIARKTQETIDAIYRTAPDQLAIKGTAWGAFNAVTNYFDHHVKGREGNSSAAENRMIRVMVKDAPRLLPQRAAELLSVGA